MGFTNALVLQYKGVSWNWRSRIWLINKDSFCRVIPSSAFIFDTPSKRRLTPEYKASLRMDNCLVFRHFAVASGTIKRSYLASSLAVSLSGVISSKRIPDTKMEFLIDFQSLLSAFDNVLSWGGFKKRHFFMSWNCLYEAG